MTFPPAWTIAPFVLMLAAIAIAPPLVPPALARLWERPRNQLIYALALGLPVAIGGVLAFGEWELVVDALVEYGQFIALLFALFVVSGGGIFLRGDIVAPPRAPTRSSSRSAADWRASSEPPARRCC